MANRKIAHFREFPDQKQCELLFELNVKNNLFGELHEEIKAVRNSNDTVKSLFKLIKSYLNKIIQERAKSKTSSDLPVSANNEDSVHDELVNMTLKFQNARNRKFINEERLLGQLTQCNIELIFQIFDEKYFVLINAPFVKSMELPEIIFCNSQIQPFKIHTFNMERDHSKFIWFKSKDKINWQFIFNGFKYSVSENDLGFHLKVVCTPIISHLVGPDFEVISKNPVEKIQDVPKCPFEERHKFTSEFLSGNSLRFVTYNVLAERYALTNEKFPYCPLNVLAIEYRKRLIAKELMGYHADILCLQEVDSHIYTQYYKDILKNADYMSFFNKKGNRISEGLCCIFRKNRFKKMDSHQIVYSYEVSQNKRYSQLLKFINSDRDLKATFFAQGTSMQVTVLKLKDTDTMLIIGNTHLYYHPDAGHVRVLQTYIALMHLNRIKCDYLKRYGGVKVSVIFCGDFNSQPESDAVEFVRNGCLDKNAPVWTKMRKFDLRHNFAFESAAGFPTYTNYTHDFRTCIDYIFIEKNNLEVRQIVALPDAMDLEENYEGLPNAVYPSDHLALVTDLALI